MNNGSQPPIRITFDWPWSFSRSLASAAAQLFAEYDLYPEQRFDDEWGNIEHLLHEVGHACHSRLELGPCLSTRVAWHLSERYFRKPSATITMARRSEAFALSFTWAACQRLGIEELTMADITSGARDQSVEADRLQRFLNLSRPKRCAEQFVALLLERSGK